MPSRRLNPVATVENTIEAAAIAAAPIFVPTAVVEKATLDAAFPNRVTNPSAIVEKASEAADRARRIRVANAEAEKAKANAVLAIMPRTKLCESRETDVIA